MEHVKRLVQEIGSSDDSFCYVGTVIHYMIQGSRRKSSSRKTIIPYTDVARTLLLHKNRNSDEVTNSLLSKMRKLYATYSTLIKSPIKNFDKITSFLKEKFDFPRPASSPSKAYSIHKSMLDKKSICIITGASKGLGRCIAEKFASKLPSGSRFILLARSADLLNDVSSVLSKNEGIESVTSVFEQGSLDQVAFDNVLKDCLKRLSPPMEAYQFEQAILINNAGSLEPLDFVRNIDDVSAISSYFNINLTGVYSLTSKFLQIFNTSVVQQRLIVNISSLAAISPMKSWGLYCMGKAARDMLMKVVGSEEEKIRTLNYAPGPLKTEMTNVAFKETKDSGLKGWFEEVINGEKLLECEATTQKLMDVLAKNSFENGAHVDYYDDIS